jgi:hypothetical protein
MKYGNGIKSVYIRVLLENVCACISYSIPSNLLTSILSIFVIAQEQRSLSTVSLWILDKQDELMIHKYIKILFKEFDY